MATERALRASDEERTRVVETLGRHAAAGRLTLQEYDERAAAAFATTTLDELDELLVDLPTLEVEPDSRDEIRRRSYGPWLLTAVICVLVWGASVLVSGRAVSFWPGWVIGPWGAVLLMRSVCGGKQQGPCPDFKSCRPRVM